MRERPILFSGPMVRAILDGRKTQTRRVMTGWNPAYLGQYCGTDKRDWRKNREHVAKGDPKPCPYGAVGDRLWVRETWADMTEAMGVWNERLNPETRLYERWQTPCAWYRADGDQPDPGNGTPMSEPWKPSIHMPRWASRLTLEVTGVRVERLQEISEADAIAEGIAVEWPGIDGPIYGPGGRQGFGLPGQSDSAVGAYRRLWDSINAKRGHSWDSNPWVWVIEFRPTEEPRQ